MSADIAEILQKYPQGGRAVLLPILQEVQEARGYLPQGAVAQVSKHLDISADSIYETASCYNQFRFAPMGTNHVQVCCGGICHKGGAAAVLETVKEELEIEPGYTSSDGVFSLELVTCIGACGLAPVISVNGELYANVSEEKVREVIEELRES